MKQKISIIIVLIAIASLALGWIIGFSLGITQRKAANINTYEECVAAGYPVQESYPEKCSVPGGDSYTNPSAAPTVEISGTVICLEHKNPDQPHTLECATGLKAENGQTYQLKDGDSKLAGLAGSDTRVKVQGRLSEVPSETYQSAGELTADSYTIVE